MFHKILKVDVLEDYILKIEFEEGITKIYDIKPLFQKWDNFDALKNPLILKKAKIDAGGHGISWNELIDLSCNELWDNGKIIN